MAELETERLRLRRWKPDDREPFARMNADARVMEFFPKTLTRDESDETADRIEKGFAKHGFGLYALELRETGQFIGFAGLAVPEFDAPFMPRVEIGWRLAFEHWGRGLATEAAREALRYGFGELGLTEIVAFTVPANSRSRRVMENIGMMRDPAGDFEHPRIAESHPLRRHVLYRAQRMNMPPFTSSTWPVM
ncbi:MAG: GNAT family N-acetyltransferase [Acidobacteriota bacterium]|nr:GNAT family N-acetyltransferase [Acidobacteriota bacterium]